MRSASILDGLAALGHESHLLALDKNSSPDCTHRSCKSITVIPHALPSVAARSDYFRRGLALCKMLPYGTLGCRCKKAEIAIHEISKREAIDAILCETIDSAVNIPDDLNLPIIIDNHNVEHHILARFRLHEVSLLKRSYAWLEQHKLRRWEKRVCCMADMVLACSDEDKNALEQLCSPVPVRLVPNVVDTCEVGSIRINASHNTVLYMGGMDWYPNRDAVTFFAYNMLPGLRELVPNVQFVVAGRNPPADFRTKLEREAGVRFTGTLADMRPEIDRATVCVVPLRIGSGTRLKILEAAAMSRPIVSTTIGAEGLCFVEGEEIIRADTPESFTMAVAELLVDESRRETMGRKARRRVQQDYSGKVMQARLASALDAFTFVSKRQPVHKQVKSVLVEEME